SRSAVRSASRPASRPDGRRRRAGAVRSARSRESQLGRTPVYVSQRPRLDPEIGRGERGEGAFAQVGAAAADREPAAGSQARGELARLGADQVGEQVGADAVEAAVRGSETLEP